MVIFHIDQQGQIIKSVVHQGGQVWGGHPPIGNRPALPCDQGTPQQMQQFDNELSVLLKIVYELGRSDKIREVREALLG